MAVITLTFTPSETETVSGIPDTVEISTNVASTIYYTLNGALPTMFATAYTGPVELPTDENSVILSAIAYYLDGYGESVPTAVLSEIFSTDQSDLDRTRYIHFEGVVYSYPGGLDIPFYYDEAGEVVFSIDTLESDLDNSIVLSDRDALGSHIGTDNDVEPVPPDETATLIDNERAPYSTPNAETFNPEAAFIQIDGREGAPEQVVKLINGPFRSLRNLRTSYGGIEYLNHLGENYISGDAMKPHYDRSKNLIVFYYVDTNTGRWVKSIQTLNSATPGRPPVITNPLVFHWFSMGRHQAL